MVNHDLIPASIAAPRPSSPVHAVRTRQWRVTRRIHGGCADPVKSTGFLGSISDTPRFPLKNSVFERYFVSLFRPTVTRGSCTTMKRDSELLFSTCREFLGTVRNRDLIIQVQRVLEWIEPETRSAGLNFRDLYIVRKIYKNKGLLPPCLLEDIECHTDIAQDERLPFAAVFSACLFPQRYYMLCETERRARLHGFSKYYPLANTADTNIFEFVRSCLPDGIYSCETRFTDFLDSLSTDDPFNAKLLEEKAQTRAGAGEYLLTCTDAAIRTMVKNHEDDRDLLRLLRRYFPSPPSQLAAGRSKPDTPPAAYADRTPWKDRLCERLQLQIGHPEFTNFLSKAIDLEFLIWKKAQGFLDSATTPEWVQSCWEHIWQKLSSGFPYYSFQAHLIRWWQQTVNYCSPDQSETVPIDDEEKKGQLQVPVYATGLDTELLAMYREGYRLVRSSIYSQEGGALCLVSGKAARQSPLGYSASRDRVILDSLWRLRLEHQLTDDELPAIVQQEVRTDLRYFIHRCSDENAYIPPVEKLAPNDNAVYNLNARLKHRFMAYCLARTHCPRLSNEEIRTFRPAHYRIAPLSKTEAEWFIAFSIACASRGFDREQSMLGSVLLYITLQHLCRPQKVPKWTTPELLIEIWFWIDDLILAERIRQGAGRAEKELRHSEDGDPSTLKELEDWKSCFESSAELYSRLAQEGAESITGHLFSFLLRLIRDQDLALLCEANFKHWRKTNRADWVHPVWYFKRIERYSRSECYRSLVPDPPEEKLFHELYRDL